MASIINKIFGKDTEESNAASNVHHASSNPADGTHSTTQGHPHGGLTGHNNAQGVSHPESTSDRLTSDFGGAKTGDFGGATDNTRTTATGGIGGGEYGVGSAREGSGVGAATGYRQDESMGQKAKDAMAGERASHISSQERGASGATGAGLSGDRHNYGGESTGQRVGEGLSGATGHHSHGTGLTGTGTSQERSGVSGAAGLSGDKHQYGGESTGQRVGEGLSAATGHHSDSRHTGTGQGLTGSTGQYSSGTTGSNFGQHTGQHTGRTETLGGGGFDGVGEGYNDSSMGAGLAAKVGGASKLEGEELGSFRGEQGFSQGGNEDAANRR